MPNDFVANLQEHINVMQTLQDLQAPVDQAVSMIHDCLKNDGIVYVAGNGGSASDAQHFAAELTGRFELTRPGYRSVALTTDTSALTAIGNDFGFERIFARQLESLARPQDCFMAISTSGNSSNLLAAVQSAKNLGLKTLSLSGRDGGEISATADVAMIVAGERTSRIQEAHIFLLHYLCQTLETRPW